MVYLYGSYRLWLVMWAILVLYAGTAVFVGVVMISAWVLEDCVFGFCAGNGLYCQGE